MSKILIVNNYKGDEESEELKSFKKYAGIAGHELCSVFRKFKREEMKEMLADKSKLTQLRLFIWRLLEEIKTVDKLYLVTTEDEDFSELARITVSMYLVANCPPEIIMIGDIQKILNNFIITDKPTDDSEYYFFSNALILSQCYLKFQKNGGVNTDKGSDYTSGAPVLAYYQPYISSLEIQSLIKGLDSELEDFDLSKVPSEDNPLTVRLDNFLIYEENSKYLMDAWLGILFSQNLNSDYDIWIFNLSDSYTNLMEALSNGIIPLERSKFGLRVKKGDEVTEGSLKVSETESPSNQ